MEWVYVKVALFHFECQYKVKIILILVMNLKWWCAKACIGIAASDAWLLFHSGCQLLLCWYGICSGLVIVIQSSVMYLLLVVPTLKEIVYLRVCFASNGSHLECCVFLCELFSCIRVMAYPVMCFVPLL